MLGKTEGKQRKVRQRMSGLDSAADSRGMRLNKLQETLKDTEAWPAAVSPWGCKASGTTERPNNRLQSATYR